MSIKEKLVAIESGVILTIDNYEAETRRGLQLIADAFCESLVGTELVHNTLGTGVVTGIDGGWDMHTMAVSVKFTNEIRRFGLWAMTHSNACPIKITDESVISAYKIAEELFTTWHWQSVDFSMEAARVKREAEKEAEEAKKTELKYQRQKESSVKAFDKMASQSREVSGLDEFYYALGWLVSHTNSVSATIPDYLDAAFSSHFGSDTPRTVVDATKKTSGGHAMQWSWSFKISLKKYDDMPVILAQYTSPSGKEITNTEFIWNLIDVYGFQFGKKQYEQKIEATIPLEFYNTYLSGRQA